MGTGISEPPNEEPFLFLYILFMKTPKMMILQQKISFIPLTRRCAHARKLALSNNLYSPLKILMGTGHCDPPNEEHLLFLYILVMKTPKMMIFKQKISFIPLIV